MKAITLVECAKCKSMIPRDRALRGTIDSTKRDNRFTGNNKYTEYWCGERCRFEWLDNLETFEMVLKEGVKDGGLWLDLRK